MEQIGCLNHDSLTQSEIQKGKGAREDVSQKKKASHSVGFSAVFSLESLFPCRHGRPTQKWTWRLRSNVSTPDQSDQSILYGQDKQHLPFITEVAYYKGLRNLLWRLPSDTAGRASQWKCKAIPLLQGKRDLQFFNIYFPPKLKITAQSGDKQTTARNLLVLLKGLFGISICVHTQRD